MIKRGQWKLSRTFWTDRKTERERENDEREQGATHLLICAYNTDGGGDGAKKFCVVLLAVAASAAASAAAAASASAGIWRALAVCVYEPRLASLSLSLFLSHALFAPNTNFALFCMRDDDDDDVDGGRCDVSNIFCVRWGDNKIIIIIHTNTCSSVSLCVCLRVCVWIFC